MNDYEVTVSLACTYPISNVPSAEIAEDIAYEYFREAIPSFEVVEVKKEDEGVMSVKDIMMAIFCEDNERKVVSITNNKIIFEDGEEKPLKEGIQKYKILFDLTDEQL